MKIVITIVIMYYCCYYDCYHYHYYYHYMGMGLQAGEAPTEDVERDWQRMERERTQLLDMKQQVRLSHVLDFVQVIIEGFKLCFGQSFREGPFYV